MTLYVGPILVIHSLLTILNKELFMFTSSTSFCDIFLIFHCLIDVTK